MYEIRGATPADVPSLEVVRQQAVEAGFSAHYPRSAFAALVATPDDRIGDWVAYEHTIILLAETDITAIGFGAYELRTARVLALYTAPDYQGRGCASSILDRFERRARADGQSRIEATVPLNAVDFFERRGYERRGHTEQDGLSMVACSKPLR